MIMADNSPTSRRYYRGYSLRYNGEQWEIWWGEKLDTADSVQAAEDIINGWLDAR